MIRNRTSVLATLLGTGFLGISCALAASAQDNNTPTTPATPTLQQNQDQQSMSADSSMNRSHRSRRMKDRSADASRDERMDEAMPDPMSVDYPFAAPGAINLYHFRTYRGIDIAMGSPTDARYRRDRTMNEMRMKSTSSAYKEDEDDVEPLSLGYPFAAPGSINLYHFHTYRGLDVEQGSVSDVQYQHQRDQDRKRREQNQNANNSGNMNSNGGSNANNP